MGYEKTERRLESLEKGKGRQTLLNAFGGLAIVLAAWGAVEQANINSTDQSEDRQIERQIDDMGDEALKNTIHLTHGIKRLDERLGHLEATLVLPYRVENPLLNNQTQQDDDCIVGIGSAENAETDVLKWIRKNSDETRDIADAFQLEPPFPQGLKLVLDMVSWSDEDGYIQLVSITTTASSSRIVRKSSEKYQAAKEIFDRLCMG